MWRFLLGCLLTAIGGPLTGFAEEIQPLFQREGEKLAITLHRADTQPAELPDLQGVRSVTIRLDLVDQNGIWAGERPLPQMGDQELARLKNTRELRKLYAIDANISDEGVSHLSALTDLEELWLDGNPRITDLSLASLAGLTKLKTLRFFQSRLSDAGLVHLQGMTQLEDLQLGYAAITDESLLLIGRFRKLKTLDLQSTSITDDGLPALSGLTQLAWLCLQADHISDAGLAKLSNLTQLTWLSLRGTQITDEGTTHLQKLTALKTLDLRSTTVTDAGLQRLTGLRNLKVLHVEGTHVTSNGIAALQKVLPHTEITGEPSP